MMGMVVLMVKDYVLKLFSPPLLLALIVLSFLTVPFSITHAQSNDDSNDKEVGVEWINDYPGEWVYIRGYGWAYLRPLNHRDEDAEGFYNKLVQDGGFYGLFDFNNTWAWESDFEESPEGGWLGDSYIADNVDYVYFAGHGNPDGFFFSTEHDGGNYNYMVHYSEALWGNRDLEWIFISACEVLEDEDYHYVNWKSAFGDPCCLHGICGFASVAYDYSELGEKFADYLLQGYSIGKAWRMATIDVQPYYVDAAIYRAWIDYLDTTLCDYYNEHLPGYGPIYDDPYVYEQLDPNCVVILVYESWSCEGGSLRN